MMKNTNIKLRRRSFLTGLGSAALTLPFTRVLKTHAQLGEAPKRLIVFFSSNGTVRESWLPSGSEYDFSLSPILSPLAPFKSKICVVDGVNMTSANFGPGASHAKGPSQLLSAVELQEGSLFSHMTAGNFGWGGGQTVDQFIADRLMLETPTRFRSLEFGVRLLGNSPHNRLSYRGPADPIPPMENPYEAIETIFGDAASGSGASTLATVDLAQQQYDALARSYTGTDRDRLYSHAQALSELRTTLESPGTTCVAPTYDMSYHHRSMEAVPYHTRLQIDTMVAALACDQTRIATFMYDNGNGQKVPSWLGIYEEHHELSHRQDAASKDKLTAINNDIAGHFAYLLQKLDSIPEGDGTMLDNSFVVWANELGDGRYHLTENVPFVLAGGAGGHFETGRFIRAGGQDHNRLLVSMCHAMGQTDVEAFGKEGLQTGPLVGL